MFFGYLSHFSQTICNKFENQSWFTHFLLLLLLVVVVVVVAVLVVVVLVVVV